jgi:hypothetical protein
MQLHGCPHYKNVTGSEVGGKGHPCYALSCLAINDSDMATTSHAKV